MKGKVLRDTQIRSTLDMGELKRAQELRVDELLVQRLRENHETIQRLTSQLQEIQEQMNSINDSGEFQEVESDHCGRWPGRWGLQGLQQAAADPRGSRTCVCANTLFTVAVAHAWGEVRINVLPWYRLVGVAKTSS